MYMSRTPPPTSPSRRLARRPRAGGGRATRLLYARSHRGIPAPRFRHCPPGVQLAEAVRVDWARMLGRSLAKGRCGSAVTSWERRIDVSMEHSGSGGPAATPRRGLEDGKFVMAVLPRSSAAGGTAAWSRSPAWRSRHGQDERETRLLHKLLSFRLRRSRRGCVSVGEART